MPATARLPIEGNLPPLSGAIEWLNSQPQTADHLRGNVVLVEFWTYTCINWRRTLPYVSAWAEKYKGHGLVVIGVHTPEFTFEKDLYNVHRAMAEIGIRYPVAVDSDYVIWRAFRNEYWPAIYIVDTQGRVRYHHFGEGNYDQSETVIQQLLAESGRTSLPHDLVSIVPQGAEAAAEWTSLKSPETYVGYERSESFVSPTGATLDRPRVYAAPSRLSLNEWAFAGNWKVGREAAALNGPNGRILYRFHARDLNLIMGPTVRGTSVRFRVQIDGKPPGAAHGLDVDEQGNGIVNEQRMYQLIRQPEPISDRLFDIEFVDPGAEAFDFTFG
jgi:thiol-disulfide isomerase/thioredoxin